MTNGAVTKQDLERLEKNVTREINKSIKHSEENLEVRLDKKFTDKLNASLEAFRQENAYQFQLMRDDLHRDMSRFTNMILNAIDPLLKEIETRQQDRELAAAEMEEVHADITDLKKRVTKLENS